MAIIIMYTYYIWEPNTELFDGNFGNEWEQ